LFGTFKFHSPRFEHCDCKQRETASFRPLSILLTEPVAPDLLYMEAKWSSLVSYGLSLDARQDFLPIALSLDVKTVRYDILKVAKRLEAELGEEQASFIEGEPSDWELLLPPEGSCKVGIDGGYVRNWVDKKHKCEVMVGKSIRRLDESVEEVEAPSLKRFGFVQTLDTKSKRRLYEVWHAQNLPMNQDIAFLLDGNDSLRQLQPERSPKATHILAWYHLSMKLTVLGQYGKGLVQCEAVLGAAICNQIERLKWSLWPGQVDKALGKIDALQSSIAPFSETYAQYSGVVKALSELRPYTVNNRPLIPNYGERYRRGEPIATGFVESTVNEVVSKRFCKKQQMQWPKEGAHLLLQTRVRTLNGALAGIFKRWYPDLDMKVEEFPMAV